MFAPVGNAAARTAARYASREAPRAARHFSSESGQRGTDRAADRLISLVRRWVNPPVVQQPSRGPTGQINPNADRIYAGAEAEATRERVAKIMKERQEQK